MKRKTPSDNSDIEEKRGRSYNGSDEADNSPTESPHSRVMPTLARLIITEWVSIIAKLISILHCTPIF